MYITIVHSVCILYREVKHHVTGTGWYSVGFWSRPFGPFFSAEVSITTPSGEVKTQECLAGADIVVQVGDEVTKDEPITTNPNVGGFGQVRLDAFCDSVG